MSQQLAIIVLIDVGAALSVGNLDGNIYLVDNSRWQGATGEGTGDLVTAIDGTRVVTQFDAPVLNWLVYSIGSPPSTLPQSYFVNRARSNTHPHPIPRRMDVMGREVSESSATSPSNDSDEYVVYPTPRITNITGEAVHRRVFFPAQYGSPDLFSQGLYWSATVNSSIVGRFAYTMWIALHRPTGSVDHNGAVIWEPVTMIWNGYINITREDRKNGFVKTPKLLPA